MKKGQEYVGKIEKVEFPNKGLINYTEEDGRITKVVVKGGIQGQTVRFVLSKKRSGKSEGRIVEVVEKSSLENRIPPCPHFYQCGGCTYQELDYDTQLKIKGEMIKDILDGVCDDYIYEGILGSPIEWEYRNKMEFSFGDEYKDGPLALGMHKKGSFHDIVTVNDCQIVNEDYNSILRVVLGYFEDKEIPFYHKMRHTGYLRHLLIRRSIKTGEILIDLVTSSDWAGCGASKNMVEEQMLLELKNNLLTLNLHGEIVGILHTVNDSLADVVQSDRTDLLYGRDYIVEKILGLSFKISVFSFFQTNSLGAEVLYEKARSYVGETKDKIVFDLYSGTGTIAQMLAKVAKKVIGVEIIEEAVEAAKINAAFNGLDNCDFIAGDVLKVIDDIEEKPDLIVLDPPRDGIHPKALEKIIAYGVDRLVYISCKPTSLARDLEILQARGYKLIKASAVDMFPQTYHCETVCLLSKN
ncbi:MAG: 23S rRNA (uracil(1939)-C(5))-methyltransferase RlmD [Lachnospiraceae bacterium]|nr:23S rRNA (uracil(1939)-C(5))-methyltransferase RlmD [Lachnospiraceae bacterium]